MIKLHCSVLCWLLFNISSWICLGACFTFFLWDQVWVGFRWLDLSYILKSPCTEALSAEWLLMLSLCSKTRERAPIWPQNSFQRFLLAEKERLGVLSLSTLTSSLFFPFSRYRNRSKTCIRDFPKMTWQDHGRAANHHKPCVLPSQAMIPLSPTLHLSCSL